MKTIISTSTRQVTIHWDSPLVIIGERINPTGRKKLGPMLHERNFDLVQRLAREQVDAGADVLDINVGVPGEDETRLLPEVILAICSVVDVPLCLDSANVSALEAGLEVTPGKPLINSVNGKETSLQSVLPLVRDHGAAVIGLTMDENGIPGDAFARLAIADRIVERAVKMGIREEDIIIDPLVLSIGADDKAAQVTLEAIELIRSELGVNVSIGASNVSFGMPDRHTINQAFLGLGAMAGATCVISDPIKLGVFIRAADALLGRDPHCRRFISAYREHLARVKPQDSSMGSDELHRSNFL